MEPIESKEVKRVLIVDDNENNRMIVQRILSRNYDCLIYHAANGVEGLEVMRQQNPHLILLDVTMPKMGGYDMLLEMRKDSNFRNVPVIIMTAVNERDMVQKLVTLGISDYILKPIYIDVIKEKVDKYLR